MIGLKQLTSPQTKSATDGVSRGVVAITTEDKRYRDRITNDFVNALRSLVTSDALSRKYTFIALNEYHSSKLYTGEDGLRFIQKARAHFILIAEANGTLSRV